MVVGLAAATEINRTGSFAGIHVFDKHSGGTQVNQAGQVAASPHGGQWDPKVAPVAQFVEQQRGLTFKHAVLVRFLADDAFARAVTSQNALTARDQAKLSDGVAVLRALGLAHGDVDLAPGRQLVSQEVLGFYSFGTKQVSVRGTELTPEVRVTLAHELTHALDDEHFGLNRGDQTSGAGNAFRALGEGDAVRVQNAYADSLAPDERLKYAAAQNEVRPDSPNVPEVFSDIIVFPYAFGPTFIQALLDHDGNGAVDRAFADPPRSDAEIVDPSTYLARQKPTKVAAPLLGAGQVGIEKPDDFGQVVMLLVLGDRLDFGTAWRAVQGWAGDSSVTYRQAGRVCVAVATASRTPGDSDRLLTATQQWVAGVPGATVVRVGTTVELRSCDPGKDAPGHPVHKPPAFHVLVLRAALVQSLRRDSHMPQSVAECTADEFITRVGPGPLVALDDTGDLPANDPRGVQLRKTVTQSATACVGSGH